MSTGLPMIAGLVPFGLPVTNSITLLLICLLCALLVFAIKWYRLRFTLHHFSKSIGCVSRFSDSARELADRFSKVAYLRDLNPARLARSVHAHLKLRGVQTASGGEEARPINKLVQHYFFPQSMMGKVNSVVER